MNKFSSILLVLLLSSHIFASNVEVGPLIKFSYDTNLGFTYGYGLAVIDFQEGVGVGPYALVSKSKKKKGQNISFGLFSGVGFASLRIGFNRMTIIEEGSSKVFWGIEGSPTFIVLHFNVGVMTDGKISNKSRYRLNLSGGAGLF